MIHNEAVLILDHVRTSNDHINFLLEYTIALPGRDMFIYKQ